MELGLVSERPTKICIYPGCERPAAPPHPLGGPQPSFCDKEEHNALTAHQERQRVARGAQPDEAAGGSDHRDDREARRGQ